MPTEKLNRLNSRPRILIADGHTMMSEALRSLLVENGHEVVGIVSDGQTLLAVASELNPDVIIVDVNMPLMNGLNEAAKVVELMPRVKIVFLTAKFDHNLAVAVLGLGPVGLVVKHSAASELLTAITEVVHGRAYVVPRLKSVGRAVRRAPAQQFTKRLTPRQREVLQLLAEGRTGKEVGGILNVSGRTVMFHKYQIMQNFDLKNNVDLVLLALKHGMISTPLPGNTGIERQH